MSSIPSPFRSRPAPTLASRLPRRRWAHAPLLVSLLVFARDWYVDATAACATGNGTLEEPFCTISEAIAAASNGDTIRIAPGAYDELLAVDKDLDLIGTGGRDVTIVDGGRAGNVVTLLSGTTTEIVGLTITNGYALNARGGGVALFGTGSLVLRNSSISDNDASGGGFGVGGVVFNDSDGTMSIYDSVLRENFAGARAVWGGTISNYGTMRIVGSELVGNRCQGEFETGGTILNSGALSIERTTIADNLSFYAGVEAVENLSGTLSIDGSILWGNSALISYGQTWSPIGGNVTVTNSDVELGWPGAGNIALDPLFSGTVGGEYSLLPSSPCIDAGDPASRPKGLDLAGNPRLLDGDLDRVMRIDMGAHELGNLRLDVSGGTTPGGMLDVSTSGTSGLTVWLGIGRPGDATLLDPWGSVFFDLGASPRVLVLGANPSTQSYTIPPTLVGPIRFVVQAIGFVVGGAPAAGNVSNPVFLTIE